MIGSVDGDGNVLTPVFSYTGSCGGFTNRPCKKRETFAQWRGMAPTQRAAASAAASRAFTRRPTPPLPDCVPISGRSSSPSRGLSPFVWRWATDARQENVKPAPETSAPSFDALRDAILRGMAHALSNRVAALGGINGLADPGSIWTERLAKALQDEARRLEDLLRLMRLLPDDGRGDPGAIELQALVPDVIALHAYQSALLQVECAAVYHRETMPVFANRPRLVHSLLLAIDAAKRHAHPRGGRVSVSYGGDADLVTIRVATEPSTSPVKAGASASEVAAATPSVTEAALRAAVSSVGGSRDIALAIEDDQMRIDLAVPTLAAGRRAQLETRPATA